MPLSQLTAGDWITVGARRWGDSPCLVEVDRTHRTFRTVDERVGLLAHAMVERGLQRGDRVAILATDSADHVEVILACLKAGLVFCDINFRLRVPELSNIVARAQPRALFLSRRYQELADEITREWPVLFSCVIGDGGGLDDMIASAAERIADNEASRQGSDVLVLKGFSRASNMCILL